MPEYVMEGRDTAARTESEFVLGFIEAALFTEREPTRNMADWFTLKAVKQRAAGAEANIPGDAGYLEIHPDSLAAVRTFCQGWQEENAALLARAYGRENYTEAQAGRDLWFTMNGHGVGFWDRPQLDAEGLGADLTEAAGRVECNLFFGGHVEYGDAPFVHFDGLA